MFDDIEMVFPEEGDPLLIFPCENKAKDYSLFLEEDSIHIMGDQEKIGFLSNMDRDVLDSLALYKALGVIFMPTTEIEKIKVGAIVRIMDMR